jgi:hypothetical protein
MTKYIFNYLSYALASRSLLAQKTRSNSQQPSANLWETRTCFTKMEEAATTTKLEYERTKELEKLVAVLEDSAR